MLYDRAAAVSDTAWHELWKPAVFECAVYLLVLTSLTLCEVETLSIEPRACRQCF